MLSALEQKLAVDRGEGRTTRLAAALDTVAESYDYALIDCPPNVGVLTFNALRAAREVVVPLETSSFGIHGVQKLLETLALLADRIGHELSEQHAMRASGVDAHPAQTAALPAEIRRASATANNRLLSVSTHLECRTEQPVSTEAMF